MTTGGTKWWVDDLTEVCAQFQLDLSCLIDGELDEVAAGRAIAHLEECGLCRDFFDDTRSQIRAHRELADPDGLIERVRTLVGGSIGETVEAIELVHRLSSIFYQLGKAYVLLAVDPGYKKRVRQFEEEVQVPGYQARGRGFVDGVLSSGRGTVGGIDWCEARHMLNGRLERIVDPLEKGRRLLEEALAVDPTHEEARFYLAWADKHEGRTLRAADTFRQLFRTAVDPANRAHAAVQLGKLHALQGDHRRAIACYHWVTMSGLADADERFYFVRFNIGLSYADLGQRERALRAFRALLDRHPRRLGEIVQLFSESSPTHAAIARQPGFAQALFERCPELFGAGDGSSFDFEEEAR